MGFLGVIGAQVLEIRTMRTLGWLHWQKDDYLLHLKCRSSRWRELWSRVGGKVERDYAVYGFLLLTLQADALIIGWLAGPEAAATHYLLWRIPEICILPPLAAFRFVRATLYCYGCSWRARSLIARHAYAGSHCGADLWRGWQVDCKSMGREHASAGNWHYMIAAVALFFVVATRWPAEMAYCLMNTRPRIKLAALETVVKLSLLGILFGRVGYLSPLLAIVFIPALGALLLYFLFGRTPLIFRAELRFDCQREL